MKTVNKEILKDAANRLMFDLSDDELTTLAKEFDVILAQMDLIGKIKGIDDVEPMTFPFDVDNSFLREDEPKTPLSKQDALKNAQSQKDGQIKLPKVVI